MVYGIVVSYNPGIELFEHLKNLNRQVSKIILFDNNSSGDSLACVNKCETIDSVDVIYSNINVGLSKAQNIAIKQALNEGADWVLTLDDDSDISDDFVANMLEVCDGSDLNVGAVVPIVKDQNSNQTSRFILAGNKFQKVVPGNKSLEVLVAISSGMLIKRSVFNEIGFMNEDYFIDYIDIDFSLRVNSQFKMISCPSAILAHRLGEKQKVTFLGLSFVVSNHSSFRRYYIYRNRIDVWKRHYLAYPKYILYEICVSIAEAFKILILEKNKKGNFFAICNGVISSFKKR
nr:glycosyltransferase [Vibrio aestuarianus]